MAYPDDSLKRELDQIHSDIENLERKLDNGIVRKLTDIEIQVAKLNAAAYVTQDQFRPIARMVWLQMTVWVGVVLAVFGWAINAGRVIK